LKIIKNIIRFIPFIITAGFIFGLIEFVDHILKNQYVQFRMIRLVVLNLQTFLNHWILKAVIISLIYVIVSLLTIIVWNKILIKLIDIRIRDKSKLRIILIGLGCAVFFICSAWVMNHYFLPDRFHIISLLTDGALFLLSILIGLFIIKRNVVFEIWSAKMAKTVLPCILGILLLLNLGIFIDKKESSDNQPNIIFIVVDCLRSDHLGFYGYHRQTSPNIDQFAQKSIVFNNAYCHSSWTKPSVASILTSLRPNSHGAIRTYDALPDRALMISEVCKNNGYTNGFFNGNNPYIEKKFAFDQGFKYYVSTKDINAEKLTNEFLFVLKEVKKKKFFAYLHYMDVHLPYSQNPYNFSFSENVPDHFFSPQDALVKEIRQLTAFNKLSDTEKHYLESLYDGQIKFVDENIGRLLDFLKDNHLYENTIVVITSDHGEEFWEHDNFEHGHTLYDELLHVPLIISAKNFEHVIVENRVRLLDLVPTVLEMADIKTDGLNFQGVSLLQSFESGSKNKEFPVFAAGTLYGREKFCLIDRNIKLIHNNQDSKIFFELIGSNNNEEYELYDLKTDPDERINLIHVNKEMAKRLKKDLSSIIKNKKSLAHTRQVELDPEIKKRLKSLGYL
jgi:arylsulfatase A-like enzyme